MVGQVDSFALSFYPLQDGNVWQYYYSNPWAPASGYFYRKVLHDTLMDNGKNYKVIVSNYSPIYTFERVDSLTAIVYRYKNDLTIPSQEIEIDSLRADQGDWMRTYRFIDPMPPDSVAHTFCRVIDSSSVFESKRRIKHFEYDFAGVEDYDLAEGFGLFHWSNKLPGDNYFLIYALVNGITYGTEVHVEDNYVSDTREFKLYDNYPNPFNPSTTIQFRIPRESFVLLKVFDVLGKEVSTLVNERRSQGLYTVKFDGSNFASGIYFYRLQAGTMVESKKLIVLK